MDRLDREASMPVPLPRTQSPVLLTRCCGLVSSAVRVYCKILYAAAVAIKQELTVRRSLIRRTSRSAFSYASQTMINPPLSEFFHLGLHAHH